MKSQHKKHTQNHLLISETKQWGNSLGIRIPKEIRNHLHLIDGSKVSIMFDEINNEIIIKKAKKKHPDFLDIIKNTDLKTLTKQINKRNQHHDDFIDEDYVGKEVW